MHNPDRCPDSLAYVLDRLDAVRRTKRGWLARCPAHNDRHPSLCIAEGERGLLVKCWAGCTVEEICAVMGITMRNLFYDSCPDQQTQQRAPRTPTLQPPNWRRQANELLHRAEALELRASRVLAEACGLSINTWTAPDIDRALEAVALAYSGEVRGELFRDAAFSVRARGLAVEQEVR